MATTLALVVLVVAAALPGTLKYQEWRKRQFAALRALMLFEHEMAFPLLMKQLGRCFGLASIGRQTGDSGPTPPPDVVVAAFEHVLCRLTEMESGRALATIAPHRAWLYRPLDAFWPPDSQLRLLDFIRQTGDVSAIPWVRKACPNWEINLGKTPIDETVSLSAKECLAYLERMARINP